MLFVACNFIFYFSVKERENRYQFSICNKWISTRKNKKKWVYRFNVHTHTHTHTHSIQYNESNVDIQFSFPIDYLFYLTLHYSTKSHLTPRFWKLKKSFLCLRDWSKVFKKFHVQQKRKKDLFKEKKRKNYLTCIRIYKSTSVHFNSFLILFWYKRSKLNILKSIKLYRRFGNGVNFTKYFTSIGYTIHKLVFYKSENNSVSFIFDRFVSIIITFR